MMKFVVLSVASVLLSGPCLSHASEWVLLDSEKDIVVDMGCIFPNSSEDYNSKYNLQLRLSVQNDCREIAKKKASGSEVLAYRTSTSHDGVNCRSSEGHGYVSKCHIKLK